MLNQTLAAALVFGLSATVSLGIPTPAPAEPRGEFSIVNGQDREATDFPEVVFITIPQDEHATEWAGCGGTILDDRWILSAAHCYTKADTRGDAIRIKAFTPYGKANDGHTYPTVHEVNRVFIHPKYDHENQDRSYVRAQYDVALLELKEPISSGVPHDPQTDQDLPRDPAAILQVPKVQLAASGEALPRSGEGLVVGRGASWWDPSIPGVGLKYRADTDQLKSADIPINQHCHSAYVICAEKPVDLGLVRHLPESDRHDNVAHRNPASCVGDSGGPLFVPGANGGRKQIGLVSNSPFTDEEIVFWSGDVCGRISTDYAAVSYLRPWIDTVMTANIPDGHPAPDVPLPAPPSGQQPGSGGQGGGSGAPAQPPAAPAPIAPKPSEPAPSKPPVAPPVLPTRPGDPELFKTLPTPSKGPMRWVLPALSDSAGSELSAGVNRLREAFAEDQVAPSSTKRSIALLANETKMADALASGVLQRDAALYLTNPDSLEPFVLSEFKAKGIKEVWLLGGPQALSPAIEQSLQAQGITTRRIAGSDRTQTAVEIAKAHQARSTQAAPHRFVARAYGDGGDETRSWADSIALGGLAAKRNTPILLTATQTLSDSVKAQLNDGVQTTLVGGHAAVSPEVKQQIESITHAKVNRIAGMNRADTAGKIAQNFDKPSRAIVIDGQGKNAWQLGFSLAGLSHDLNAPILLTAGTTVPPETKQVLKDLALENVICMGEIAVCEAVTEATNQ